MPYSQGYTAGQFASRSRLPLTPPEVWGSGYPQAVQYYGAIGQPVYHQTVQEQSYGQMKRATHYDYELPPVSAPIYSQYRGYDYYPHQVPILPPIRTHDLDGPAQQAMPLPVEEPKEEKVAGGVASELTYKLEHMIEFICEVTQGMHSLYRQQFRLSEVDIQQTLLGIRIHVDPLYRKYVSQVLTSTRLPISTLMLALHYMAQRIELLQEPSHQVRLDASVNQMLTTALMLASKFLDDNTFQNRSWAEVSRVPVKELNKHELAWLEDMGWHLQFDVDAEFSRWFKHYERLAQAKQVRSMQSSMENLKLSSPEFHMSQSARYPATPLYTPPSFYESSYSQPRQRPDPWNCVSSRGVSPPSAGPSYPSTPGEWFKNPPPGFSQHSMAYSSRTMPPPQILPSNQSPHYSSNYGQYSTWDVAIPQPPYQDCSRIAVQQLVHNDAPRVPVQQLGYTAPPLNAPLQQQGYSDIRGSDYSRRSMYCC